MVAVLSTEEKIGQTLMLSLRTDANGKQRKKPVVAVDDELARELEELRPGGIILYAENLVDPAQTERLISDLQAVSGIPLFVAVDEEGGRVDRLASNPSMKAPSLPPNLDIGRTGQSSLAYEKGKLVGEEVSSLGFNVAFSTIADIFTNPKNKVIGDRSYGSDPALASDFVEQEVRGIQEFPVIAVLKHFPGHGNTSQDSHLGLASSDRSVEELRAGEFLPFEAGIGAGARGVMVGHIILPNAAEPNLPSSFSATVIQTMLRGGAGFEGLIFTDSLEMQGASPEVEGADRALCSFLAGADVLVEPPEPESSFHAMLDAYRSGAIDDARLDATVKKIMEAKTALGLIIGEASFPERPGWERTLGQSRLFDVAKKIADAAEMAKTAQ